MPLTRQSDRLRSRLFTTAESANPGAFTATDWALFCSISTIWGASFLLIDIALDAFRPGLITFLRAAGGATLWLVPAARRPLEPEDRLRVVVLSFVWVAVPFTIVPVAQQWVNSALTGMLNGAMPIFAALLSTALLRRLPRPARLAGLLTGSVGVTAIAWSTAAPGAASALGVALILCATACYGVAVTLAVPLQQRYGAVPVMARIVALGALWTAPYGLYGLGGSQFGWPALLALLAVGVVGTGVAYWIMGTLVGRAGSVRASFITYLIPVVALVLGVVLRGDRVGGLAVVGVILATIGALLAARRER